VCSFFILFIYFLISIAVIDLREPKLLRLVRNQCCSARSNDVDKAQSAFRPFVKKSLGPVYELIRKTDMSCAEKAQNRRIRDGMYGPHPFSRWNQVSQPAVYSILNNTLIRLLLLGCFTGFWMPRAKYAHFERLLWRCTNCGQRYSYRPPMDGKGSTNDD
jgi:hypothetical protein